MKIKHLLLGVTPPVFEFDAGLVDHLQLVVAQLADRRFPQVS